MHTTWNTATSVIRPHGRPASARLLSAADQRQAEATQRRRRARAILASLMMPSSSSATHAQVSSQRGVDTGLAAHEPCPYGRSRAEPGRPAGHLGSLPRSAARGRLAMARSPDPSRDRSARNRCPPGDVTCTSESFDQRGRSGGSGNRCGTSRDRRLWSRRSRAQSGLGATDASYNSRYASGVSQVPTG